MARLIAGKARAKTGWLTAEAIAGSLLACPGGVADRLGGVAGWLQQGAEGVDADAERASLAQDSAGDLGVAARPRARRPAGGGKS
jgi:hypothetical protein